jgi:hypothetical protein
VASAVVVAEVAVARDAVKVVAKDAVRAVVAVSMQKRRKPRLNKNVRV